jgi:DNA-binding IclR family transcriptional regulator
MTGGHARTSGGDHPRPRSKRTVISVVDAAANETAIVKSAARTLAIFEYFDDVRRELRVGEIALRLGYPQSSTSYLLKSLVKAGYLDYNPKTRAFIPTPRIALLGSWISRPAISDGSLIRVVRTVADATRLTVTLSARNGIYAQYIHVLELENGFPIHIPVGTCRLLVWSAAGFALLEDESPTTIRALVQRTNAEVSNMPARINAGQVLRHVETFRQQGYFLSDSLVTPGGGHISMRLPPAATDGRNIVLGAAGPSRTIVRDAAKIVAAMQQAIATTYGLERSSETEASGNGSTNGDSPP